MEEADARSRAGDWAGVVAPRCAAAGRGVPADGEDEPDGPGGGQGIFPAGGGGTGTEKDKNKDFAGAEQTLKSLSGQKLSPEQEWGRLYLLCRIQAAHDPEKAWRNSTGTWWRPQRENQTCRQRRF